MGYPIMFYVWDDVREKLKGVSNRSQLINHLLIDYFNMKDDENISIEERKRNLQIKKLEFETLKKIQEIKDNEI